MQHICGNFIDGRECCRGVHTTAFYIDGKKVCRPCYQLLTLQKHLKEERQEKKGLEEQIVEQKANATKYEELIETLASQVRSEPAHELYLSREYVRTFVWPQLEGDHSEDEIENVTTDVMKHIACTHFSLLSDDEFVSGLKFLLIAQRLIHDEQNIRDFLLASFSGEKVPASKLETLIRLVARATHEDDRNYSYNMMMELVRRCGYQYEIVGGKEYKLVYKPEMRLLLD